MQNKIYSIIILTFILIMEGCAQSAKVNSIYIKDISIPSERFITDFEEINKTVSEKYSLLEPKNIDINKLYAKYADKINQLSAPMEYGKTLLEYFAELQNSHTNVYFKKYRHNCSAKLVEGRIFIDWIDSESLKKMGINPKDEIIEIDNIPVMEWLKHQEKYISSSTKEDRVERSVWSIFNSYSEENRTLQIKTQNGLETITIKFNEENNYYQREKPHIVEHKLLSDSIGYIAINSMMGDVVNEFKKKYLQVKDLPALIIDIRRNGGGNSGNSEEITEYLIKQKQKACVSRMNLTPTKNHYKGKLIVLTDVSTFSAAESFALDLKESGNAILIGLPTGGDTGNQPRNFTTKNGTSFRIPTRKPAQISPNGFFMEGQGVEPDYMVYLTVEDYMNDIDTVLEYAINYINNNSHGY